VSGTLPAVLTSRAPMLEELPAMPAALAVFITGAALIVLGLYAGLSVTGRGRADQRAEQP